MNGREARESGLRLKALVAHERAVEQTQNTHAAHWQEIGAFPRGRPSRMSRISLRMRCSPSPTPPQPPIRTIISPMRTGRQHLRRPDEVRYIQCWAAAHDGRMVTIGKVPPVLDRDWRRFAPRSLRSLRRGSRSRHRRTGFRLQRSPQSPRLNHPRLPDQPPGQPTS